MAVLALFIVLCAENNECEPCLTIGTWLFVESSHDACPVVYIASRPNTLLGNATACG